MNTLDTMKLALAMLEKCNMNGWMLADYEDEMYQAISALKQAIEEYEKAEPVAEYHFDLVAGKLLTELKPFHVGKTLLYTHPPKKEKNS
jgi:hypothetical protein